MILAGTIASAQAVRREDAPKPDMDISQLGEVVLNGAALTNMDISQLGTVVIGGDGITTMDISQLGGIVLHETEF